MPQTSLLSTTDRNCQPNCRHHYQLPLQHHSLVGGSKDQIISIKTTNPKCRLYWCLIEFILAIQSVMLVFSTPLLN